ncbi:MAG: cholesterol oxidase substrate-binding domain-containing protein [Acidimicrobiales bacterium]|nr:cholesterol oxidase substrate-binding domain-containing protein [Acidimicrobiales bacterium]
MSSSNSSEDGLSRRRFLAASAASAGLLWQPIRKLTPGDPEAGTIPPGFPGGIALYRRMYENWALEIRVDDVWTAVATSADDIVNIVNWAAARGWRVRPSGAKHGWAPFTVMPDQPGSAKVVLVDTRKLNKVGVDKPTKTVYAQAGATLDQIMIALEERGLGFSSIPAPGELTIAGVLAVNGHGAAVPARNEATGDRSYGSMSNRIVSLKAVVYDEATRRYKIATFDRTNPATKAMLTGLGRVFITSVVLKAETNCNLRCVSYTDITSKELFAKQGSGGRTFASYVEKTGRAEAIVFPFTDRPWFKTWEVAPTKPASSRATTKPYNYPFSDNIPLPIARLAKTAVASHGPSAKQLGRMSRGVTERGLDATDSRDLWGSARVTQHYIKASTLRAAEFGYAILTARRNIQRVLHEFVAKYDAMVADYERRGLYPANMPIELRCTGIDDPSYVGVPGAEAPSLSASAPRADRPEWDTVVFINSLSLVGSAGDFSFKAELEDWVHANYRGDYALARVEWSKGWAYTDHGGWRDPKVLNQAIPSGLPGWDFAAAQFAALDPKRVFSNELLDRLFPS